MGDLFTAATEESANEHSCRQPTHVGLHTADIDKHERRDINRILRKARQSLAVVHPVEWNRLTIRRWHDVQINRLIITKGQNLSWNRRLARSASRRR